MGIVGVRSAAGQSQSGSTQEPQNENDKNRKKSYTEENPANDQRKIEGTFKVEALESADNGVQKVTSNTLHRKLVTKVYVNIPKGMKNKAEYKKNIAKAESKRLKRPVQVIEAENRPLEGQEGANLAGLNAQQFSDFLQQNVTGWLANELPSTVADNAGTQGLNAATNPNINPVTSPILNNPTYYNGGTNPFYQEPTETPLGTAGPGSVRVYNQDAQKELVEELMKPINEGGAGLSRWGAAALAGRMMGVEATRGYDDFNNFGGGHYGIGQWGTSRARALGWIGRGENVNSALQNGTLKIPRSEQIRAVVNELNTTESAAARKLRDATNIDEGVRAAASYERAGGYNGVTDVGAPGTYKPAQQIYNNATEGKWRGFVDVPDGVSLNPNQ